MYCPTCGMNFPDNTKDHIITFNDITVKIKAVKCPGCAEIYIEKGELSRLIRTHGKSLAGERFEVLFASVGDIRKPYDERAYMLRNEKSRRMLRKLNEDFLLFKHR